MRTPSPDVYFGEEDELSTDEQVLASARGNRNPKSGHRPES